MTISELLAWATQEVRLAEALRHMAESLPEPARTAALEQAELSTARSRWLDLQVAHVLDLRDQEGQT